VSPGAARLCAGRRGRDAARRRPFGALRPFRTACGSRVARVGNSGLQASALRGCRVGCSEPFAARVCFGTARPSNAPRATSRGAPALFEGLRRFAPPWRMFGGESDLRAVGGGEGPGGAGDGRSRNRQAACFAEPPPGSAPDAPTGQPHEATGRGHRVAAARVAPTSNDVRPSSASRAMSPRASSLLDAVPGPWPAFDGTGAH